MAKRLMLFLAVAFGIGLTGCTASADQQRTDLSVFIASSLNQPMEEIAKAFEPTANGVKVILNAAGSQTLRMQIEQGADADVFISADERHMDALLYKGLADTPSVIAYNRMAIIADKSADIKEWHDLAKKGIKIALAHTDVPAGQYTIDVLDAIEQDQPGFKQMVLNNVVTYEMSVKDVAQKVLMGEADAGIVYVTDIPLTGDHQARLIDIPNKYNITSQYLAVAMKDSKHSDAAKSFIEFILSDDGQKILKRYGFTPISEN
ncbi:molybdate ABC transporter substrate-binding protein [Mahella sp.]|uniref:molybdate ABC transporter substrate-binding protein n=1 Tax=Mahella sp. TaxID=2798721 RepID=UPI0025BDC280|nr:molybdate ABC transporter substrate-binding protein [Mahella sp.]MBZ4666133.1 molybdenum transporter, periplasmic molybdate-binding protein [Mahella sp.]